MRRTRIAHVVLSLQPGGLERLICNLAASPELSGCDVVVCCMDTTGDLAEEIHKAGGRVVLIRRAPGLDVRSIFRLAKFLRRERIDAVHTHSLDPMFYAGWAARLAGVPVRIHTQHLDLQADMFSARDCLKFRLAARAMTAVVSITQHIDRGINAFGVPAKKRHVIVNGIDEDHFGQSCRISRGPNTATFRFGVAARLAPQKGLAYLLEAFAQIYAAEPGVRLRIAGDGPSRPELEAQAARLGIAGAVEFLGFQSDVRSFLNSLDVFVLPSLYEGLPLALLEAMAAGLPVIATAVDGNPDVVENGHSGILVAPRNAGELYSAMKECLKDPELRRRLGTNAEARIREGFSLRSMARAYGRLYTHEPTSRWKEIGKKCLQALPPSLLFFRGPQSGRQLALTFDDGPDPQYTPRILEALRKHGAKATFFLIGERAEQEPALVRQILADGHELGNHSHSHPDFERLPLRRAMQEISRTTAMIEAIQGSRCRLFRPPKGKLCLNSLIPAWLQGMKVVMWNVDLKDFRAASPTTVTEALAADDLGPGDVILYHGNSGPSIEALPMVLEAALRNGRHAVTISQLQGG